MQITISQTRVEQLELYSSLLNRDISTILDEALEEFFVKVEKELQEKNLENENALTNLSYDEFWYGVDLD